MDRVIPLSQRLLLGLIDMHHSRGFLPNNLDFLHRVDAFQVRLQDVLDQVLGLQDFVVRRVQVDLGVLGQFQNVVRLSNQSVQNFLLVAVEQRIDDSTGYSGCRWFGNRGKL